MPSPKKRTFSPPEFCGDCHYCCYVPLGKAPTHAIQGPFSPCEHVSQEGGCAIYEDRPDECRTFEIDGPDCRWKREFIPLSIKGEHQ